ncbi:MAG: nucleotidyltransferase family protein [Clostridia bacterium]
MLRIGCVLMASGVGRRFGANKLLIPFAGRPLIDYALFVVPDAWPRVAVARDPQVARLCREAGFGVVEHDLPEQRDTIRLGLERIGDVDGCFFLVGDQPRLTRATLMRMAAAFEENPSRIVRAAFGDCPGNPVLFPKACFAALARLAPGESGGKVIYANPDRIYLLEVQSPLELTDVDTPEALERLERSMI